MVDGACLADGWSAWRFALQARGPGTRRLRQLTLCNPMCFAVYTILHMLAFSNFHFGGAGDGNHRTISRLLTARSVVAVSLRRRAAPPRRAITRAPVTMMCPGWLLPGWCSGRRARAQRLAHDKREQRGSVSPATRRQRSQEMWVTTQTHSLLTNTGPLALPGPSDSDAGPGVHHLGNKRGFQPRTRPYACAPADTSSTVQAARPACTVAVSHHLRADAS